MSIKIKSQRGDTIVEVLLATALLSGILFTSWAIVNRASQISLAARQRVFMVDQLKEQAEIIQSYYGDTDGKAKVSRGEFGMESTNVAGIINIENNPCDASRDQPTGEINGNKPIQSFHFNESAKVEDGIRAIGSYDNAAVWVQRVTKDEDGDSSPEYNDFYVQACWLSTGGGVQKEDSSKIIVRLNS